MPFEIEGTFKSTFVSCANIFYQHHDVLQDYVEIYLSEPVENWQKLEKRYNLIFEPVDSVDHKHQSLIQRRVAIVNRKLQGDDPIGIMTDELRHSLHRYRPHFDALIKALHEVGGKRNAEEEIKGGAEKIYSNCQRVIDMALDKRLLGRMWTGWIPFA